MYILLFYYGSFKSYKCVAVAYSKNYDRLEDFADGHYIESKGIYEFEDEEYFDYSIIDTSELEEILPYE